MRQRINTADLAARLQDKCFTQGLSVRQAARAAGVSHATLSRVLRGNHVPDRENLLVLAQWLDVPVEDLTINLDDDGHNQQEAGLAEQRPNVNPPETVALVLRADRSLRPEDAEALSIMFRSMYNRLQAWNQGKVENSLVPPARNGRQALP